MEFNSARLQYVVNNNDSVFMNVSNDMNKVSDDIKSLEKYLKDNSIGRTVGIKYEGIMLSWERYGSSGYRLLLTKPASDIIPKPLIEWDIETRMEAFKFLPTFIEDFANILKNERNNG